MLKWYSPTVAFRNVCIFEYWSCDCLCARVCCPCRSIWVNSVQCSFRWSFTNAIYFGCLHPYNVFWLVCGKYLFQHTNEIYDSSTEHIIVIIKYVFCHGVNKNKTSRHEKKHTHTHTQTQRQQSNIDNTNNNNDGKKSKNYEQSVRTWYLHVIRIYDKFSLHNWHTMLNNSSNNTKLRRKI